MGKEIVGVPEGWPPRRGRALDRDVWRRLGPRGASLVVILAALVMFAVMVAVDRGGVGIIDVGDTEVVVIVNYLTGKTEVDTTPGYKIVIPYLQRAYEFDKEPVRFVMKGNRDIDDNHIGQLTVRADDGSEYWFDDVEIQYRLEPGKADVVLHDSGPGETFKRNWVKSSARSLLRDEFGRYSAEEGADPTNYNLATQQAREQLNQLLNPHGIDVMQIITPRPKFEDAYEKAIEDRKLANQQVEKLKVETEQLARERERRLADVERAQNSEYQRLLGELEGMKLQAEREALAVRRTADAYKIEQSNAGAAQRNQLLERARGLTEQARKEAEGLRLRVDALAPRGEILVREALARKLGGIRFQVIPYQRDPTPMRIEHLDGGGGAGATLVPATGKEDR